MVTLTAAGELAIENDVLNLANQEIGVIASDGANNSAESTATIAITHVNDNAPTIDTNLGSTQIENTAVAGDIVATFTASDLDASDVVTFSISSGNANNYFEIADNTSGVVTLTAAGELAIENDVLNLANQEIGVTASDGANNSAESTATIAITHVNDNAPTIDTNLGSTQIENTTVAGDIVATFTASDLDASDAVTFSISSGKANNYFEIADNTSGVVTLTAAGELAIENDVLNLANQEIGVTASDGINTSSEANATIVISHVNDNAPTIDTNLGSTQIENTAVAGDIVATFTASDLDASDVVTFSISSGNANNYFEIVDNTSGVVTLTAAGELAIENDVLNLANQEIGVIASDGANNSAESTATIAITHVNDNAPSIDTTTGSAQVENIAATGDVVATFSASDLDGDKVTYYINSGNNDGYFSIDSNTGVVTLTEAGETILSNDALVDAIHSLAVTATDGVFLSAQASATIYFQATNDAPTINTIIGSTQVENIAAAGDVVASFTGTDLDGDAVTYNISSGNDNGYFIIDVKTGVVTLTKAGEVELNNDDLTNAVYTLGVTATDGLLTTEQATATIDFVAINDVPSINKANGSTQIENIAIAGDLAASFTASDLDGDALTYRISSGNDNGYFTIDANSGNVTLTEIGEATLANDALIATSFKLSVVANDGQIDSLEMTADILFSATNDAALVSSETKAINETDAPITTSGQLTASDVDNEDNTFIANTLVGSYGTFKLTESGAWTFTANDAFDALNENESVSETFNVASIDGTASTVTIQINGTNDAATVSSESQEINETNDSITTSGQLTASDVDNEDNTFIANTLVGSYGTFNLTASGAWTFTANEAFDQLNENESVSETFNVASIDGTASTVSIQINGTNDAATVSSESQEINETNDSITTSGQLTANDVDNEDNTFIASTLVGSYGTFNLTASGAWTFTANDAFDQLNENESVSETFNVASIDGTASSVNIQINGTNDAATVSSESQEINETNDSITTSGQLTASDVDNEDNTFIANTLVGSYGAFNLTASGAWTFTANDAFDALNENENVSETFNVASIDGTASTVSIQINGTNDAATVSSESQEINETNDSITTSGQLTANDVDNDNDSFISDTLIGTYGEFNLTESGAWTFTANDAFDQLNENESVSETFNVASIDGTASSVTIQINGTNDAATVSSESQEIK